MATFLDLNEKEWTVRLDAPLAKRIAEVTGVKLTDLSRDPFVRLSNDPELLVDVLWLFCEKQAKAEGITSEQFGEAIGDRIDEATEALVEAVLNFFPSARRLQLRSLIEEVMQTQEKALTQTIEEMKRDREKTAQQMARRAMQNLNRLLESSDLPPLEDSGSAT